MRVLLQSERRGLVAEPLADHLYRHASLDGDGRMGVPEVM